MNKKRGVLIVIVLLLLIGTGSFVFAGGEEEIVGTGKKNPSTSTNQNRETNDQTTTVPKENQAEDNNQTTQDPIQREEPIKPAEGNQTTNNTRVPAVLNPNENNQLPSNNGPSTESGNNNTENNNKNEENKPNIPVKDTSYEDASAAIDSVIGSQNQNDINKAQDLINKVEDPEKRKELQNNLDVINKVNHLSNLVANRNKLEDVEDARRYRDQESIIFLIADLTNETLKKELINILNNLAIILNDISSPVIDGVDKPLTNEKVVITINDENPVIIYINGKKLENSSKEIEFTQDGNYEIIAVDDAYNEEKVTFTIDTVKPVLEGIDKTLYNKNDIVKINVTNKTEVNIHVKKDGIEIPYTMNEQLKEDGTYEVYGVDKAGNQSEVITFTIDATAPIYEKLGVLNYNNYQNNTNVNTAVVGDEIVAFVTFNEKLNQEPIIKINGEAKNSTYLENYSNATNHVYIAKYNVNENTNQGEIIIEVSNYADEAKNYGNTLINNDINHELYNKVEVQVTEDEDKGFEFVDGGYFTDKQIIIKNPNYGYMLVYNWKYGDEEEVRTNVYPGENKTMYNTTYEFTIYDKNGDFLQFASMTFDNIKPKVKGTGKINNKQETISKDQEYDSVNLTISDSNLDCIKRVFDDGRNPEILETFEVDDIRNYNFPLEFNEGGHYTIIAVDKAGNETSIEFNIKNKVNAAILSAIGSSAWS